MKWNNRGHEFDNIYREINSKKTFYLFGAGDYGNLFFNAMKDELNITGYIDNDPDKIGKKINGLPCVAFDDAMANNDAGFILTMSQIARISVVVQLSKKGLVRGRDYFVIEEFISIYNVYKYNKVYLSSISFLPSTACNLNCRYCLNFNPFAKQFYKRDWENVRRDVDLFFSVTDHIMLFHISGGEPFIYPHLPDLVAYIDENYGDRIDRLRMVTNGTIVPRDDVIKELSKRRIEITVDDYRLALPEKKDYFDRLIQKLDAYNISYYINTVDSWIDLAPEKTDYSDRDEEWLISHRDNCNQSWQELRDGKLYSCNYAAYAVVSGNLGSQDMEETYNLNNHTPDKNKELVEFRLGYTTKGYTNFCRRCRGFTPENTEQRKPAVQCEDGAMRYVVIDESNIEGL